METLEMAIARLTADMPEGELKDAIRALQRENHDLQADVRRLFEALGDSIGASRSLTRALESACMSWAKSDPAGCAEGEGQ